MMMFLFSFRAYAEAGPSVQHSEQREREEVDFVSDSEEEKSVESSNDEAKEDGGEGKKKKPRSGFRDRKVINKRSPTPECGLESYSNQCPICKHQYISDRLLYRSAQRKRACTAAVTGMKNVSSSKILLLLIR